MLKKYFETFFTSLVRFFASPSRDSWRSWFFSNSSSVTVSRELTRARALLCGKPSLKTFAGNKWTACWRSPSKLSNFAITVLAIAWSMPTRRDFGGLGCPWWVEKGLSCPVSLLRAKYNAPFVVDDIIRYEGDTEGVLGDILDRLYITTLVSPAHGVFDSLSCLFDLKFAGKPPWVRRGPSLIMPLIVRWIIDDALAVIDEIALAVRHIWCKVDQCQRNERNCECRRVGDPRVIPGGRVDTNPSGSCRKDLNQSNVIQKDETTF